MPTRRRPLLFHPDSALRAPIFRLPRALAAVGFPPFRAFRLFRVSPRWLNWPSRLLSPPQATHTSSALEAPWKQYGILAKIPYCFQTSSSALRLRVY